MPLDATRQMIIRSRFQTEGPVRSSPRIRWPRLHRAGEVLVKGDLWDEVGLENLDIVVARDAENLFRFLVTSREPDPNPD
jgi:hypothetical protein